MNRLVRTRMPGGVAGASGDYPEPLCRSRLAGERECSMGLEARASRPGGWAYRDGVGPMTLYKIPSEKRTSTCGGDKYLNEAGLSI